MLNMYQKNRSLKIYISIDTLSTNFNRRVGLVLEYKYHAYYYPGVILGKRKRVNTLQTTMESSPVLI